VEKWRLSELTGYRAEREEFKRSRPREIEKLKMAMGNRAEREELQNRDREPEQRD